MLYIIDGEMIGVQGGNSGSIDAFIFRGVDAAKVCLGKKLKMRWQVCVM